jgi:hypothetical protein
MEASLLADATLAEIETLLAVGEALQLERTEIEEEEFRVSVEVTPFELPPEFAGALAEMEPGAPSLFGAGSADAPSLVQRVEVRVVWDDGIFERSAKRVTFAFDTEAAQALTSGLGLDALQTGARESPPPEIGGLEMPSGAFR